MHPHLSSLSRDCICGLICILALPLGEIFSHSIRCSDYSRAAKSCVPKTKVKLCFMAKVEEKDLGEIPCTF